MTFTTTYMVMPMRCASSTPHAAAAHPTEFIDVDMRGHSDYPFQTFAIPPGSRR